MLYFDGGLYRKTRRRDDVRRYLGPTWSRTAKDDALHGWATQLRVTHTLDMDMDVQDFLAVLSVSEENKSLLLKHKYM